MARVRYIGEGFNNGPWGSFVSGQAKDVSVAHAAYVLTAYPGEFEACDVEAAEAAEARAAELEAQAEAARAAAAEARGEVEGDEDGGDDEGKPKQGTSRTKPAKARTK